MFKRNALAVRRPAWGGGGLAAERSQRRGARAIRVAYPQLSFSEPLLSLKCSRGLWRATGPMGPSTSVGCGCAPKWEEFDKGTCRLVSGLSGSLHQPPQTGNPTAGVCAPPTGTRGPVGGECTSSEARGRGREGRLRATLASGVAMRKLGPQASSADFALGSENATGKDGSTGDGSAKGCIFSTVPDIGGS